MALPSGLTEPYASWLEDLLQDFRRSSDLFKIGDITCIVGVVSDVKCDHLMVLPHVFFPGRGFWPSDNAALIQVSLANLGERSLAIRPGSELILAGSVITQVDRLIIFHHDALMLFRPEFNPDQNWDALHLFAGSFNGWGQGLKWLCNSEKDLFLGLQIHVDLDPQVMEAWSQKHNLPFEKAPLKPVTVWTAQMNKAILGSVGDISILHAMTSQFNLLCTISPPCVSWSRAGKGLGLSCAEGWAFVEAIILICIAQPVLVPAECVKDIASHDHFHVIEELMRLIGYKKVWSQVATLHQLAHCTRDRWLAVWVRNDIAAHPLDASFRLIAPKLEFWSSDIYAYAIPKGIKEQLVLSSSECDIYGNAAFLPSSLRSKIGKSCEPHEVIRVRVPDTTKPLPTLCANYSAQHLLNKNHLERKGIFAVLINEGTHFAFLDPFLFASLLGACEDIFMPDKIPLAFRAIGNAIAVPHAVLALVIGFQSITKVHGSILKIVQQCWNDRLTTRNAIVLERKNHVVLASIKSIACSIPAAVFDTFGQAPWQQITCTSRFDSCVMHTKVSKCWTLSQLVHQVFGLDENTQKCAFLHSETVANKDCPCVGAMFDLPTKWTLFVASKPVLDLHAGENDSAISPTVPFSPVPSSPGRLSIPVGLDADAIFRSCFFLQALGLVETHLALKEDCIECQFVSDQPCMLFSLPFRKRALPQDDIVTFPLLAKRPRNQCILVNEPAPKGFLLPPFPAN